MILGSPGRRNHLGMSECPKCRWQLLPRVLLRGSGALTTLPVPCSWAKPSSGSGSRSHSAVQGEGATSREQEQENSCPCHWLVRGLGQATAFLCASVPLSGAFPTSQACCEV